MEKHCHSSKASISCAPSKVGTPLSWWTLLFLTILPKCPFCVMAYSGAVSLCSGTMLYPNADAYMAYGMVGVGLLVAVGILLNQRGVRTWLALALALLGIGLVAVSQFYLLSEVIYYSGVLLLFFGVWFNGSFFHFYYKIFHNKTKFFQKRIL